jgi:hypothetical protein
MVVIVTRRTTLALLACIVAVVAAACSNGNVASIPPPRSVEKSTAISLGDNVCQALAADSQSLVAGFKGQAPQAKAEDVQRFLLDTLTPRIERAVGDFHRIGEPTKDRQDWDKLVTELDNELIWFKAQIGTDPIGLLTPKPFPSDTPRFAAYGFKVCGQTSA